LLPLPLLLLLLPLLLPPLLLLLPPPRAACMARMARISGSQAMRR